MIDKRVKHGHANEPLYAVWKAMRQRCNNPNHRDYKWYGARGVRICNEWNDYSVFREWSISNGYDKSLTIDRIDGLSDYSPNNCRWITIQEQQRNRRKTDKWINKPCMYNPECLWKGIELCKKCNFKREYYNKRHREYMAKRKAQCESV